MRRILITGRDSYIGASFEAWLRQTKFAGRYWTDTVDMRGDAWRQADFSGYDAVFHVAGIAHVKETRQNQHLYYEINRDLAVETAKKAKSEGAGQFVLLSSMSVYGLSEGRITPKTAPAPKNHYGKSKLAADLEISALSTDQFPVAILRPPMVYGRGCKGNYQLLRKAALKIPFFPLIQNRRSMIYVENLAEYVRSIIDRKRKGIFFPQNLEYVSTSQMVLQIARIHKKNIRMIKTLNPVIRNCPLTVTKKVFGNLIYAQEAEGMCEMISFIDSINRTER